MGTFPMVFLKNTSSMVEGLTERSAGRSSSSFPKRQGWVGYLERRRVIHSVYARTFYAQTVTNKLWLVRNVRQQTRFM